MSLLLFPTPLFGVCRYGSFFLLMTWSSVIPLKNHKAMGTFSIFKCSNAQTKASPFLESSEQHVFSWRDAWCAHMCLGLKYLLSDGHVSRESLHFGHLLFVCSQFSGSFKRSVTWSLLDICGMEDFVHSYLIANYWKSPATFKSFLFFFFNKINHFWLPCSLVSLSAFLNDKGSEFPAFLSL